jgi:molecular chaperone DnaJ
MRADAVPRDYYEVLGVERDADATQLKKAFRGLARELHPDVNRHDPEAEEKFKEAAAAYEILSDPDRRRTYDTYGHEGLRSGGFSPRSAGYGSFEDVLSALFGRGDEAFGDIFGFGAGGPASGGDVGLAVEVTLAEVLSGTRRKVEFEAIATCDHCHGNGAEPGTPIHTCETCGGAGQVREVTRTAFGQMLRTGLCPTCGGAGKIAETPCGVCEGHGRMARDRTYEVEIPAGIESGQRIRVAGAGHVGEPGAGQGDLYVEVGVAADDRFEREGSELITAVSVSATRAMLGGDLSIDALDGPQQVDLAPGTQPGERIRLKGLGLPTLRSRSRGDLHVVVDVIVPGDLDDEQLELADRLERSLEESNLERGEPGGWRARLRGRRRASRQRA